MHGGIIQFRSIGARLASKYSLRAAFDGRVLGLRTIVGALLEAVLSIMKEAHVDDPKAPVRAILDGIVLETVLCLLHLPSRSKCFIREERRRGRASPT